LRGKNGLENERCPVRGLVTRACCFEHAAESRFRALFIEPRNARECGIEEEAFMYGALERRPRRLLVAEGRPRARDVVQHFRIASDSLFRALQRHAALRTPPWSAARSDTRIARARLSRVSRQRSVAIASASRPTDESATPTT